MDELLLEWPEPGLAVLRFNRPQRLNALSDDNVAQLLQSTPTSNLPATLIREQIQQSLDFVQANQAHLAQLAKDRAQALLDDHSRVRQAARDVGQYSVSPCLPVDVIGVYVLLPESL